MTIGSDVLLSRSRRRGSFDADAPANTDRGHRRWRDDQPARLDADRRHHHLDAGGGGMAPARQAGAEQLRVRARRRRVSAGDFRLFEGKGSRSNWAAAARPSARFSEFRRHRSAAASPAATACRSADQRRTCRRQASQRLTSEHQPNISTKRCSATWVSAAAPALAFADTLTVASGFNLLLQARTTTQPFPRRAP